MGERWLSDRRTIAQALAATCRAHSTSGLGPNPGATWCWNEAAGDGGDQVHGG